MKEIYELGLEDQIKFKQKKVRERPCWLDDLWELKAQIQEKASPAIHFGWRLGPRAIVVWLLIKLFCVPIMKSCFCTL